MKNTLKTHDNITGLRREDFQKTVNGKSTDLFIIRNNNGLEIAVTNFGAAIVAIMTPDQKGNFSNIILGHDNIDSVINSPEPFLNTVIGRYGNRIANGKFTLCGKEYSLNINNGPNSLHGGPTGFHRAIWDAVQTNNQIIVFKYTSPDGDEGFPGKLDITMTYSLDDNNNFTIDYKATTDQTTIVNLTSHGFFNLAGIATPTPTILNNILTINADYYIPINEVSIPLGEISKVENTPFDFRTPHIVGNRIDEKHQQTVNGTGYDHCFVLNKKEVDELSFAVKCTEPTSGRTMEVYTTEPGIQLYTGNWLNGFSGANGATFPARSAICFEAQHFPDSPNNPHFPSVILKPNEEYKQTTIYKFGIEQ